MPDRTTRKPARSRPPAPLPTQLPHLNLNAAAIDIGATSHYVAVPPGRDTVSVREFATFTTDLHRLADWLEQCGVDTVVMESTGVYWIPVFELLEQRGAAVLQQLVVHGLVEVPEHVEVAPADVDAGPDFQGARTVAFCAPWRPSSTARRSRRRSASA